MRDSEEHPFRELQQTASPGSGLSRLVIIIRWFAVFPAAVIAWYAAFFVGAFIHGIIVAPCRSSDVPRPGFCEAMWFPLDLVEQGVFFFGAGLSATLVVMASTFVAPSYREAVAWLAVGVGTVAAMAMGYAADALAEAGVAIGCGICTAWVQSRPERNTRRMKVARSDVIRQR